MRKNASKITIFEEWDRLMRKIEIREKLAPFSHTPGTEILLPRSDWRITAFPAMLKIGEREFPLRITGPVREFTVQLDLERDCIWVLGIAKEGHYRLKLSAMPEGVTLSIDRSPKGGIEIGGKLFALKEKVLLTEGGRFCPETSNERLSFGNWKAQDWDLVRRRADAREFLPPLFLLGQKVPSTSESTGPLCELIDEEEFTHFFLAGCSGILVPHLRDEQHLGIIHGENHGDPLSLLRKAYQKLRATLFREEEKALFFLPHLPKEWVFGRASNLQTVGGVLSLEWSKGMIRRAFFAAKASGSIACIFPRQIRSFRVNREKKANGDAVDFMTDRTYYFDQFQK